MAKAKINIKYKIVMYTLGWYEELISKNITKGIEVVLPKYIFIHFIKNIGVISKGERALYRNLEFLEKKKFISYTNKDITITPKGKNFYNQIKKEVQPFIDVMQAIDPQEIVNKTKKLQTRLL